MSNDPMYIHNQFAQVNKRIKNAALACGRDAEHIQLLAVSKTKPVSNIISAYEYGHRSFAENYVQEAVDKIQALDQYSDITWHFIGPLQSNKSKFIAEYFAWMHSLDRIKIAQRLNQQRSVYQPKLMVCVQVNIDNEPNKAGVAANEVIDFIDELQQFDRLCCRGIMSIPKATSNETERAASFANMQDLFEQCKARFDSIDTLSMGMSADLELAVAHGTTMVRIGTDLFGKRET